MYFLWYNTKHEKTNPNKILGGDNMPTNKELLLHWWRHYGRSLYTSEEYHQFEQIIEQYGEERVMDVVISSCIFSNCSPDILLLYMRARKIGELFKCIPNHNELHGDERAGYEECKDIILSMLASTYK